MFDLDAWQEIWVTITRNKLRSVLTGFGVTWGIFLLILLFGIGNSLEGGMRQNIEGFASNSCFFSSGVTSEAYKGHRKGRRWNINNRDVELIKQRSTAVDIVSPMLFGGGGDKNVVRGRKSGSYGSRGVYGVHFKVEEVYVLQGRLFNEIDTEQYRKVCIIGNEVYETLFEKEEDAIGQYIRLNGIYFQVVGVIQPKSNAHIGGDLTATVFIPFTTMQRTFNQGDVVHFLACTAKKDFPAAMVEEQVNAILKTAHSISPSDEKAIRSFNLEMAFKIFDYLFIGLSIITWSVGIGALLSGIIGISNIMTVAVKERTREIGVRRALGARPARIMIQILSESFVLTALAGIIGFVAGILVLEFISLDFMWTAIMEYLDAAEIFIKPIVEFGRAINSLIVLIFCGLLAGVLPAYRALKVKAIDAIRDE